jgi:hypothetical protein
MPEGPKARSSTLEAGGDHARRLAESGAETTLPGVSGMTPPSDVIHPQS